MADVSLRLSMSNCHIAIVNICGPLCEIIHALKITMNIINVGPKNDIKLIDKGDIYNSRPMYTRSDCPFRNLKCFAGNSALSQLLKS